MNEHIKIVLLYLFTFLLSCCNGTLVEDEEFVEILDMVEFHRYEESIDRIIEFRDKYPDYIYQNSITAEVLLFKCYEATNNFQEVDDIIFDVLEQNSKNNHINPVKQILGISQFEMYLSRFILKRKNIDTFWEYDSMYPELDFFRNHIDKDNYFNSLVNDWNDDLAKDLDYYIAKETIYRHLNFIALRCIALNDELTERNLVIETLKEDVDWYIQYLSNFGEYEHLYVLADFINFQTIDNVYQCDILWDLDVFQPFWEYYSVNEILIDENLDLLRSLIYRDNNKEIIDMIREKRDFYLL